jgi:hypothetical protein
MATETITSTDAGSPDEIFSSDARAVRVINPDPAITIHVRDTHAAEEWVDLPPGYDHYFVRSGISRNPIVGYADSGSPDVICNPIG